MCIHLCLMLIGHDRVSHICADVSTYMHLSPVQCGHSRPIWTACAHGLHCTLVHACWDRCFTVVFSDIVQCGNV